MQGTEHLGIDFEGLIFSFQVDLGEGAAQLQLVIGALFNVDGTQAFERTIFQGKQSDCTDLFFICKFTSRL